MYGSKHPQVPVRMVWTGAPLVDRVVVNCRRSSFLLQHVRAVITVGIDFVKEEQRPGCCVGQSLGYTSRYCNRK